MLIHLLGFAHPRDILGDDVLPATFRNLWYYVASISFRSTEAFASYLCESAAHESLALEPLLPLTKKQCGMIGAERVKDATMRNERRVVNMSMAQFCQGHPEFLISHLQ